LELEFYVTTDTALIEKREELKRRLAAGEYKTLIDIFLEWFDRLIRKITRRTKPFPLWLITVILSLVSTLIGFASLYIAGDLTNTRNFLGLRPGFDVLWVVSINLLFFADLVLVNQYIGRILVFWNENVLGATESILSLEKFEDWLESVCNRWRHLLVTIIGGIVVGLYFMATGILRNTSIGYSPIIGIIILSIVISATLYQFWMAMLLSAGLRQYDVHLFSADPSSSELISRLSGELGFFIYIVAFSGTIGALLSALAGELLQIFGVAQVLGVWLPLIAMFSLNQTSLSSLVRRAKWKTLNEIQAKVEKLQAAENFEAKETIDAINRLLDYHERVNRTRVSALDFRTYLSFINSLLLPLLAFILGNLDLVLKLFGRNP
jgi:hypothetical protein